MAFNLEQLTSYVEENRLPLIKKAVLGGKTIGLINLQTDIKGSAAINLIDVDPSLQEGGCGWNAEGGATLSQRIINTKLLKSNQAYCDKDFVSYWNNYMVKVGAGKETMPFEEYITEVTISKINESVEKMVWNGDSSKGAEFDGFLKVLGAEEDVITAQGTGAMAAIKAAYMALPEAIIDDAVMFVGADTMREYVQALIDKNYFHYDANAANGEVIIPGTNTKVIAVNGLNGTKKIVAGKPSNFVYGCDLLNDKEEFDFWYSKDNREYRLAVQFNGGVNVAYPNEVVVATVA